MIGIQLKGRLGNQMFQYATARTLAEKLSCQLFVAGNTPTRRFGLISRALGLDRHPSHTSLRQNGILHEAFACGPSFIRGRLNELSLSRLRRKNFPNVFAAQAVGIGNEKFEEFDPKLFEQKPGTWLEGLFQSDRYFADHAGHVRKWFGATPANTPRIAQILAQWPKAPEQMVAVHVRRGDYLTSQDALGGRETGWALPRSYYDEALARLPRDARLAVFSDDPDWAAEQFKSWRPWVARGNSAAVDMLAMARCRSIVMANSSFSWWAAWLNTYPGKTVLAPEFHLGFRLGRWVPGGIAVDGWRYLRVGV